jgi:rare lipoprotein A
MSTRETAQRTLADVSGHLLKWWLLSAATLMLGACATQQPQVPVPPPAIPSPPPQPPPEDAVEDVVPKAEPRSRQGNPPFYEVGGRRYFVLPSAEGYLERGVASWYGPGFHRGKTSNGEVFDMHGVSAAHKTLPLPSYVRVTNLKNGRSITVRVNDRGPFKDTRIIDLSRSAAAKLDMLREGTAFVEVRALTVGVSTAAPASSSQLFVQAGAFGDSANASRLVERLKSEGHADASVREDVVNGRTLYRVRVGPVPTVPQFDRLVARLRQLGLQDARLAAD